MSRKSQETTGPNVDIPATTESNTLQHERLLFPLQFAGERYRFAETYGQQPMSRLTRDRTLARWDGLRQPFTGRLSKELRGLESVYMLDRIGLTVWSI